MRMPPPPPGWRGRMTTPAAAGLAACLAALPLHAAPPAPAPAPPYWHSSLHNTGWTKKDGAPSSLYMMAQDSQGWIWFAASDGLYRFDGARFERVEQIDGNALLSPATLSVETYGDAIWVGYQFGGISVFEHGKVRHYRGREGAPGGSVYRFGKMPGGTMWVSSSTGMHWLEDGRWHHAGPAEGLHDGHTNPFLVLADGSMLVYLPDGVYQSTPNGHQFHRVLAEDNVEGGELRPDGKVLINSQKLGLQLFDPASGKVAPFHLNNGGLPLLGYTSDRRGALWVSTGAGVQLLDRDFRVQKNYSPANGFTGKTLLAALDDREGNLWFATENGIDRVREVRLNSIELPAGLTQDVSVVAGDDGAVWVNNAFTSRAYKEPTFGVLADGRRVATPIKGVTYSHRQPDGTLWFGSNTAIWRQRGSERQRWPLPAGFDKNDVQAMTTTPDGTLWLSVVGKGVHTFRDGVWSLPEQLGSLGKRTAVSMLTDPQGRLWIGYTDNRMAMLDHGVLRQFDASHGLDIGNTLAMSSAHGRLWVGGPRGLLHFEQGRFVPLKDGDGERYRGVSGIVETAAGELWLHGADGLVRIEAAALAAALSGHAATATSERFGYLDGHLGTPAQLRPLPSLVQAGDGRLWYATTGNIGWIDPARIARNRLAPTVLVTAIKTEQQRYLPAAGLALPERTSNIELDFTATALTIPERVRFRYRLLGLETQWHEAGNRRQAYYTNLGPGDYRFEVEAANEDGVWSRAPAASAFRIAAAFTQTVWFKLLCGGAGAALLYLLYLARLAQMSARIGERMRVRARERERIARTLHDTFLQSVQALILRFHSLKLSLPDEGGTHQQIDKALRYADDVLSEGRDQVMDLRVTRQYHGDLAQALEDTAGDLAGQHDAVYTGSSSGETRALAERVQDEVFHIGREALLNAFQHAGARQVTLALHYGDDAFSLKVADDGCGLDPQVLAAGGKAGHWGLIGMRERAGRLDGSVRITSAVGAGTEVWLSIPAAAAYLEPSPRTLWQRARARVTLAA